jgi:hypothetical protein
MPNRMAPVVRQIFAMRGDGASQGDIAEATGVRSRHQYVASSVSRTATSPSKLWP